MISDDDLGWDCDATKRPSRLDGVHVPIAGEMLTFSFHASIFR